MSHPGNSPKVHLFISCRKLKDTDVMSKTDPFVEVYEKAPDGRWTKLGATEVIENNLNPDFVKNFELSFLFEETQAYRFVVYDSDNGRAIATKDGYIGEVECILAEIQGSPGQQLVKTIRNKVKPVGNILLRTEQISENYDRIMIQFEGKGLEEHSGIFHSFKPFYCLSRTMENGTVQKVYSSEFVKGKNVIWKMMEISLQDLCNADPHRPIKFDLFDHHGSGNHDLIASAEVTLHKITEENCKSFTLINPKKVKNKKYKDSGTIIIKQIQIVKVHSFMDYVRGGCNISLQIAIDFTASNGLPHNPSSLHFLNPNGMNQYEQALFAVSNILLCYDSDKQVPVYGFGGKINGTTSHCFNVNFNPQNPNVNGLENIMRVYRNALQYVELNGPTLFGQFLAKMVAEIESERVDQRNQVYNVLLILTDGEIHDMQDTVNLIVRASNLPLSIVIVGIGNDSFTNMRKLDADDEPLIDSRGTKMSRDIVQFVPFREVNNLPQRLAKEVLAEIPTALTYFFKNRGIFPNEPVSAPEYDYERSYSIAPLKPALPDDLTSNVSIPPAVNVMNPSSSNPSSSNPNPNYYASYQHPYHPPPQGAYSSMQPGNPSHSHHLPQQHIYSSMPPGNHSNYPPAYQSVPASGYNYMPPPK